jgi:methionine-rich copper-binding protein CopC
MKILVLPKQFRRNRDPILRNELRDRQTSRFSRRRMLAMESLETRYSPAGLALQLDGVDDYATASDNATLDLGIGATEDFTVEASFYVAVPPVGNKTLVYKQNAYALFFNENGTFFRFWTGPASNNFLTLQSTVSPGVGWHHIAAVFDNEFTAAADLFTLYLDGAQIGSTTGVEVTPGINNSSSALNVGAYLGINPFSGWMDEVRLSNSVRYSGTYAVPSSPFVSDANTRALWHFDEVVGSTVFIDASGNSNALTGVNGAKTGNPPGSDEPPLVWTLSPADNANGVSLTSNLLVTFSEPIQKGSGNIVIKRSTDNSVFQTIAVTDAAVTIAGSTVTINPNDFVETTGYYVEVVAGAFKDLAGNNFAGISGATAWNFTTADTTAPTWTSLSPADNAIGVPLSANLVMTFGEAIQKGSGNIVIKRSSDNSVFQTIAVTDAAVTIAGSTMTINPNDFVDTTGYYVEVAVGAINDLANNNFAGISGATAWNFTTADTTAPTVSHLSPADNATGVSLNSNLVITFSEPIQKGSGNIVIKKSSDNSVFQTIAVTSTAMTVSGATATIDPNDFAQSTEYYVEMVAGSFKDLTGNAFAGISGATFWNFQTAALDLDFAVPLTLPPGVTQIGPSSFSITGGSYSSNRFHIPNGTNVRVIGILPLEVFVNEAIIKGVLDASGWDDGAEGIAGGGSGGLLPGSDGGGGRTPSGVVIPNGGRAAPTGQWGYLGGGGGGGNGGGGGSGGASGTNFGGGPSGAGGNGIGQGVLGGTTVLGDQRGAPGQGGFGGGAGTGGTDSPYGPKAGGIGGGGVSGSQGDPQIIVFAGGGGGGHGGNDTPNSTYGGRGGAGGGAIHLTSTGLLLIEGSITANGGNGSGASNSGYGGQGGGGAGGTVWLTAPTVTNFGTVTARGGNGGNIDGGYGRGGGGGAGRIRVDTATGVPPSGQFDPVIGYTTSLNDATAPTLSGLLPADDATGVLPSANLVMTFGESIQKGSGNIVIKRGADNSIFQTIAVTDAAVTIAGSTVTINPNDFVDSTGYYVEVAVGAIKDLAGNNFAGISGATAWNFTTADTTAPTWTSLSPADNAVDVPLSANLVMTFGESIQKGSGNIVIKKSSDNSVFQTIAITDAAVTIVGSTVTINPNDFVDTTGYYVEVVVGAIKDLAGNNFAGISGATAWNFTSASTVGSSLRIVGEVYYGEVGDEQGTGIAVVSSGTNYEVYTSGISNALNSEGLVNRFGPPNALGNIPSLWAKSWPGIAGSDQFFGLEATMTDVFVAGNSFARTTDSVGDKEPKGITVDFPVDGGNSRWDRQTPAAPGAFTYGGHEVAYDVAVSVENGQTFIYVSGQAQSGFSNSGRMFLSKLNSTGNVVWTRTDSVGIPPSTGRRIVAQGGFIYVAGFNSDSGNQQAYMKKYDPNGALVWAKVSALGVFNGMTVDAVNGSIYAVGQTSGTNADFLAEKWDLAGNITWSKTYDRNSAEDILNGAALLNGRLYAVGSTRGATAGGTDGVVLELDPATGELTQSSIWGGSSADSFADIGVTSDRLHVVGTTRSFGAGGSDLVYLVYARTDTTAPTVSTLSPADNATGVSLTSNLTITFNETIQKGSGNVVVKRSNDNSVFQTLAVSDASVTVTGSLVTINANDFAPNTSYFVEVAVGAFKDMANNNFAGISGATNWNFTTKDIASSCVPQSFFDGFEGPQLDPFWTKTETSGFITVPSTVRPHSGSQSLQLNSTSTASDKWIHVDHTFDVSVYGTFSVWLYDTGADVNSSNYLQLNLTGAGDRASIGTNDYDLGPGNNGATYYYSKDNTSWQPTSIDRTQAWHKFEITTTPNLVKYVIDGVTVFTESSGMAVKTVSLYMFGPSWRPAFVSYFDDFSFTPSNVVMVDFDKLDSTVNPQGGEVLANYLGACGLSLRDVTPGTQVYARDARSIYANIQPVVPTSPFNVLTQEGSNDPVSYTLASNTLLSSVQLTRPYIRAGQTGVALPEWTATAFDASGNVLSTVGEPTRSIFVDAPAATFTLNGPHIASVRINSNNRHFAAFSAVILDNLVLVREPAAIVDQSIYYRGSSFSQGGSNIAAALDTSKSIAKAGLVSQTLSYANLINTTRGINGMVLDVAGLASTNLTAADFVFRMSPTGLFNEAANPPSSWATAPAPTGILVTPGTSSTPARVRIEWDDNAIANRWLQLQVLANANTGLPITQVYYFGHLQGEVNGTVIGGAFFVTTQDQSAVLPLGSATVTTVRDLDKNGFVTTQDLTTVRNSIIAGRALRVITIPPAGSASEGVVGSSGGSLLLAQASLTEAELSVGKNSAVPPISDRVFDWLVATAPLTNTSANSKTSYYASSGLMKSTMPTTPPIADVASLKAADWTSHMYPASADSKSSTSAEFADKVFAELESDGLAALRKLSTL